MSGVSEPRASTAREPFRWLPEWARPLDREKRGLGSLRLAETTILILLGVFLAVATVNDVVQQTHVNQRLVVDLATWRAYTGHVYHNLTIEQDLKGSGSTREVICGNTSPGAPKTRTQLCLVMRGPVVHGAGSRRQRRLLPTASHCLRRELLALCLFR